MLKELVDKQRYYTEHFFSTLDFQPIEELIQLLLDCKGVLFFTGVGKSGLVAKKIAFTMVSTGTRAFYLSPTDALHGDLGMVSSQDVFIILSKSGESDELINLIPAIRNKGARLIGVVCNPHSRLGSACHITVILPFKNELCPFDMAPTMSTTVQLLFGDLLTIALMQHKNFSLNEYALNHPSGRIGKRMTLKVKDLMLMGDRIPLCKPDDYLGDVLVELSNKRCGCIIATDENLRLLGIFTDGDLRRTLQKVGGDVLKLRMEEVMNRSPCSIGPDVLAWEAMKRMEKDYKKRMMMLPVVDSTSKLLGLLHLHDLVESGV
ncbi:MAG: SIS domain-containing protein [Parachlamydiaceae bacterium]